MTSIDGDILAQQLDLPPMWRLACILGAFALLALLPLLSKLIDRWLDSRPAKVLRTAVAYPVRRLRKRPADPTEDMR